MEARSMFWGVVLKPDKRYEQMVEEPFHVSKACLEPATSEGGKVTSVYLEKESDEFIICNLKGNNVLSENLDLNFNAGEKICFRTEGGATVHLTGYLVEEDDMPYDDSMMMADMDGEDVSEEEEDDDDDEDDDSLEEEETPKLVKKRKLEVNGDSPATKKKKGDQLSALDKLLAESKKSKSKDVKQAQATKKVLEAGKKPANDGDHDEDDDDDDSGDMDEDMEDSGEEEEESGEEEEENDDDDDEEEEEDSDAEEESPKTTPLKTPKNKKDKNQKKEVLGVKNGTPKPKDTPKDKPKDTPKGTPKQEPKNVETPKSKKKNKNKNKDQENKQVNGQQEKSPTKTPGKTPKRTLKGGLQVEDLKVGNGPEATPGKHVGMYYKGQLENGKVFDSCLSGKPFKFKLGKGEVIKGWEVGINGMKVGGKRRLTVPAQMAYGSQGAPPDIPPNSTLTFDVECKMVN